MRGSSNGKDATVSTEEKAVRGRPPRSIIRSLIVREVPSGVVSQIITDQHFLHSMPSAPLVCFGVHLDESLVGALVVTAGARHAHRLLAGSHQGTVATVARLWITDQIPKNAESRVLSVVSKELRQSGRFRALVSFADPAAGHVGTIYQAAGWSYLGQSEPSRYVELDGEIHHPRSVYSRHRTNSPGRLRAMGIPARAIVVGGKHRYCLVLDRSWAWRLSMTAKPYPRAGPQTHDHLGVDPSEVVQLSLPCQDIEHAHPTA
jgi:hypothetical protein